MLLSGEGLTFFSINNRSNLSVKKKAKWGFPGCFVFENTRKNFTSSRSQI